MEGTDIIAHIYPYKNSEIATNAIKASPQYVAPIPQTHLTDNSAQSDLDPLPHVEIRFHDTPRSKRGIVFGSNPNCDMFLDDSGVSSQHFSLTFDETKHLIVKDLGSLNGTQVTYDDNGAGKRRDFHWIVGGAKTPRDMTKIINVNDSVLFQIVVPHYNIESPEYIDRVNLFCQDRPLKNYSTTSVLTFQSPRRIRTPIHHVLMIYFSVRYLVKEASALSLTAGMSVLGVSMR